MIRVLIADDHAILRRGLREILVNELPEVVSGEASNADEVLDQVAREEWDLVILDLSMPGRSGLDVLRTLKSLRPALPVLVLSMHPEDQYGTRVLRAGASGYMNKESAPEELITAIRRVLGGRRYVSPVLADRLAADLSRDVDHPRHEALSDRELEVLRLLAAGQTVGAIAVLLHISDKTVSTYRARVLEKLNLATNADLVRYAIEYGLTR